MQGKEEPRKKNVFSFIMRTTRCQAKEEDKNVMINANYELRTASRNNGGPPEPTSILHKTGEADPKVPVHARSSCLDSGLDYRICRMRTGRECG